MTIDEKIRAAIKVECDRQHVGEDRQRCLRFAYNCMFRSRMVKLTNQDLLCMAGVIEPDNNGRFRQIPVTFVDGGRAVPADNVPRAMENWIEYFNGELSRLTGDHMTFVDAVIKEFLDIHPFSDGNGRTAWLLRVWLLNQWDDPQPLPDYYG